MPDAIELLVLCIHAGRSPHQAIEQLAARAPPSPAGGVRRRRAAGAPRSVAGRGARRAAADPRSTGPGAGLGHRRRRPRTACRWRPCSIGWPTEARATRRRLGEAEARRLPVRLTFPLVACTLPSFVLLAIAPAVLGALSTLRATAP